MSDEDETAIGVHQIADEWRQRFPEMRLETRGGSAVEVYRGSGESGVSEAGLVAWYVPEDGIAYGRVPIHVVEPPDDVEQVVDAAIGCLEHFEGELDDRGWRITDDGTLRGGEGAYVFEATIKRVVESADEAAEVIADLADDPIEYEVN